MGRIPPLPPILFKDDNCDDEKKIISCINCGASVKDNVCEYCGTKY